MPKWQRTIKLQPEWGKAKDGEITRQQLAASVAKKLRAVRAFPVDNDFVNDRRDELADEFEWLASQPELDVEDFDALMDDLYDWGDTQIGGTFFDAKKVCWINAFSTIPA